MGSNLGSVKVSLCCEFPTYLEFTSEKVMDTLKKDFHLKPNADFTPFERIPFCASCNKPCIIIEKFE